MLYAANRKQNVSSKAMRGRETEEESQPKGSKY